MTGRGNAFAVEEAGDPSRIALRARQLPYAFDDRGRSAQIDDRVQRAALVAHETSTDQVRIVPRMSLGRFLDVEGLLLGAQVLLALGDLGDHVLLVIGVGAGVGLDDTLASALDRLVG